MTEKDWNQPEPEPEQPPEPDPSPTDPYENPGQPTRIEPRDPDPNPEGWPIPPPEPTGWFRARVGTRAHLNLSAWGVRTTHPDSFIFAS